MVRTMRRVIVTIGTVILVGLMLGCDGGPARAQGTRAPALSRVAAASTVNITGAWQVYSNDSGNAHLSHFTLYVTQTGTTLTGADPVVGPLRGAIQGQAVDFGVIARSVEDGYGCQGYVGPGGLKMTGRILDNLGGGGMFVAYKG